MRGRVIMGERPCPGVLVSDGVTVTSTGLDGTFSLTPAGPFVFLTRPAETRCDRWFVPATADAVTFVLEPAPSGFPHRFVHVSDTHLSAGPDAARLYPGSVELGSGAKLARFLSELPSLVPGLSSVINTGDLTDQGTEVEFAELKAAVAGSPIGVHLIPGNHDHLGGPRIVPMLSRTGYVIHEGDPAGYEKHIGPRWYSFDLPGLHVVALDWHSHEIGLDHLTQNAWIRADLESQPPGTPWILLSHDQPWHSILDGLPSAPLATFSGHRHVSRVVRIGETLHVNTPTPLFAGLDFTPPSYRVVTWDGSAISLETRTGPGRTTFGPSGRADRVRWRHQLSGAGHRAAPVVAHRSDGTAIVLATAKDEDRAEGWVEAVSLDDGSLLWRTRMRASVKGAPAVYGSELAIVIEVSGDVVALGLDDGAERWRTPSPDPLRLFAFSAPLVIGPVVIAGDPHFLRALDPATGEVRWERDDLVRYQTIVDQAGFADADGTVVVGTRALPISFMGLDPATGETRWPTGPLDDALRITARENDTSLGTPLHDPETGDLYVSAVGALARISPTTAARRWRRQLRPPWNPATPAATPYGIATVDGGDTVLTVDRASGSVVWSATFAEMSDLAMSSYRSTPHLFFAGPTLIGDRLAVPGLDGTVRYVSAATGARLTTAPIGEPLATTITVAPDETQLMVTVHGGLIALR